jgi:hypothetical protein
MKTANMTTAELAKYWDERVRALEARMQPAKAAESNTEAERMLLAAALAAAKRELAYYQSFLR